MDFIYKFLIFVSVIIGLVAFLLNKLFAAPKLPVLPDGWWSSKDRSGEGWWSDKDQPGTAVEDTSIRPFKISISDEALGDLQTRLNLPLRLTPPLEGQGFQYGFNSHYFKEVVDYWKQKYDWRKQEAELNKFPQYKTNIEGLDIHFIHIKSEGVGEKIEPLLILHGWPGSIVEFTGLIPQLIAAQLEHGLSFDLVIPSLPGYGFSQGADKPGLASIHIAQIMRKLMERIGHSKFYVQGGDWGAVIGTDMGVLFPNSVVGLHVNMAAAHPVRSLIKTFISYLVPSLMIQKGEEWKVLPWAKRFSQLMEESGYFHLQSTKPDTIGIALLNSPVSLAAYILEKFSTWTNPAYRELPDGGLTKKFTLDQLLTNIHIYWFTQSITTSMRLYSEFMTKENRGRHMDSLPCTVPSGVASFRYELVTYPESFLQSRYTKLVHYTDFSTGGHFAALEEPELLAADVITFIKKVIWRKSFVD